MASKSKIPQPLSTGEATLEMHLRAYGLTPVTEYQFSQQGWRADFAFPEHKLLIEVEGGTTMRGRHNQKQGYETDCIKYNLAAMLGFTVLRYTTNLVRIGLAARQIAEYITSRAAVCPKQEQQGNAKC